LNKLEICQEVNKLCLKTENQEEFLTILHQILLSKIDKEKTKNYTRIIPNMGKFYGVPKPSLWIIARELGKFIQKNPDKAEDLFSALWEEGSFEAKQITAKTLEKFAPKHPERTLNFIKSILNDLDNWSVCDCLAMYGVEPIVYNQAELILPLSEKCVKSSNKWIRRFGVVTLRGYKKIKIIDKVFTILGTVMEDDDKDVMKVVAWVLREISKGKPNEVAKFLAEWSENGEKKSTKWIIKEGMKKLPDEKQKEISNIII